MLTGQEDRDKLYSRMMRYRDLLELVYGRLEKYKWPEQEIVEKIKKELTY